MAGNKATIGIINPKTGNRTVGSVNSNAIGGGISTSSKLAAEGGRKPKSALNALSTMKGLYGDDE